MNKKYLSVSIVLFVVIAILVSVYLVGKNSNQMKSLITPQTTDPAGNSVSATIEGPLHEYESGKISDALKSDEYYLQCLSKAANQCSSSYSSGSSQSFTGTYNQIFDGMKSVKAKDLLDACYSDAIRNCAPFAIKEREQYSLDPKICDSYTDVIQKETCRSDLYRKLAVKNDDVSVCTNIEDNFQKTYCQDTYHIFKSAATEDPSWCDRIAEESQKNSCKSSLLTRVAVERNMPEKCGGYTNADDVDGCLNSYVFQTQQKLVTSSGGVIQPGITDCALWGKVAKYYKNKSMYATQYARCIETNSLHSYLQTATGSRTIDDSFCSEYPTKDEVKECEKRIKMITNPPSVPAGLGLSGSTIQTPAIQPSSTQTSTTQDTTAQASVPVAPQTSTGGESGVSMP